MNFGILVFDQAEELDFIGTWEMLTMWSKYAGGPENCLIERLRALGDVQVVEQRYVRDGNVWSSAGVSVGTDLMLAFIAEVAGEQTAGKVQFGAEYYPCATRYGGFEKHPQAPAYVRNG